MSDYFDDLELGLKDAVRRRAHLPWHLRVVRLSMTHRGLAALVAALVIATPTVAAVGAVEGWFRGASDVYYPASATQGLGKVLSKNGRLLPIRVADPGGGPPWGIRLVKTTRGETCIQVGRVVNGQIGALGIDGAWHNDHEFHEIKPNDQLADICGATDGAGNGFAVANYKQAPASVDVPLDNNAAPGAGAMRMIFAGLLGPEARTITYRTPGGQIRSAPTSGGVGAYLLVFRQTPQNCDDYSGTALFSVGRACQSVETGNGVFLSQPSPVTKITYSGGRVCSDEPSPRLVAAYRAFNKRMATRLRKESGPQVRAQLKAFFKAHGVRTKNWLQALQPECQPVGWVAPKLPKLTAADVASPIKLKLSEGVRFCVRASQVGTFNGAVPCDQSVPAGDRFLYGSGPGQKLLLVTISFTARQPVTSANSYYEWTLDEPGPNGAGGGGPTSTNIRAGQRITLSQFEPILPGTYHGTVAYVQSAGQNGSRPLFSLLRSGGHQNGTFFVGHMSFKLPVKHSSP